jgi:bifunctional non-homologous end joining protein LigD
MRSRRPGSKGNEWLLIKHRDQYVVQSYDIDKYDWSVLTRQSLAQIAGDQDAAQWQSSRPAAVTSKNAWLAETLAKVQKEKGKQTAAKTGRSKASETQKAPRKAARARSHQTQADQPEAEAEPSVATSGGTSSLASSTMSGPARLPGALRTAMPRQIRPMLATLVDAPFSDAEWFYEVKWDGYRAVAFLEAGKLRLVSRNQNELTNQFPELAGLAAGVAARTAVLDGEICALDEEGRPSFSLMQQRTGGLGQYRRWHGGNRSRAAASTRSTVTDPAVPIVYYAFDLLYLDGFDLRRVDLKERKNLLRYILGADKAGGTHNAGPVRYSAEFDDGIALYQAARARGLEGVIAKRRRSCYLEKRSRDWLKIKITQRQECVIGGYTDPRGSRENFGSLVLGLYDRQGRLIHVGQAGSGFTDATHERMWRRLKAIPADRSPFFGKVESDRRLYWVKPELVAQIQFTEWTHEGESGQVKMRAPVFEGLRFDKAPRECVFEATHSARKEVKKAERGEAA